MTTLNMRVPDSFITDSISLGSVIPNYVQFVGGMYCDQDFVIKRVYDKNQICNLSQKSLWYYT